VAFPTVPSTATYSVGTAATTSEKVNLPGTIAAGDLLIALVTHGHTSGTITWDNTTAGAWTQLYQLDDANLVAGCWYKWADGTEDGLQLTTSISASTGMGSVVLAISGAHASTPPEYVSTDHGSTTNPDPASLDPSGWATEDTLWIGVAHFDAPANSPTVSAYPTANNNVASTRTATRGGNTAVCTSNSATSSLDFGQFTLSGATSTRSAAIAVRPAGATTQSGSGSATLPIATASGTGKRALKSTGSATLPLATASGTGKRALKGSGTATLPLVTASGAGKKERAGTGSSTLPALTATGAAKRALKGSGTPTLTLVTASGSGSVSVPGAAREGSGSAALPSLTGSGSAKRALKSTGASTLPVLTAAGTAKRALLGSGEATLPLLTVEGVGGEAAQAPEVEEQRSGGYGWANLAAIERRRRKREEEELADALEVAMAAEGLIEPDPVVAARHVVRDYVKGNPPASRRMQRAVEYAYRAQSDLAWQLAAREIARQEEEDFALLMVIAFAA
jgi:hypothetical protein